jgi:hypothetical protein
MGVQLTIMPLVQSINADMKSDIGSSRSGLRPYPLRFCLKEAGAKLSQLGPLGVALEGG